jgi:hypothetical protein
MELRSFEKPYVALLNSSNWATGGPLLISSFPTSVVAYMAHTHQVDGMASFPWSSSLEQHDLANILMA